MSGADRSGDAAGNDGAAVGVRDAAAAGDGAVAPGGTLLEPTYDHRAVEARRRRDWRERDAFATPAPDPSRRDAYVKSVCPFTSGHIHVGHVRSYTIGDAYARAAGLFAASTQRPGMVSEGGGRLAEIQKQREAEMDRSRYGLMRPGATSANNRAWDDTRKREARDADRLEMVKGQQSVEREGHQLAAAASVAT